MLEELDDICNIDEYEVIEFLRTSKHKDVVRLLNESGNSLIAVLDNETLEDQLKIEYYIKVHKYYTLEELMECLPEK